jgi:hypothetical protein
MPTSALQSIADESVPAARPAVESRLSLRGKEIVVGHKTPKSIGDPRPRLIAQWRLDPDGRLVCGWTRHIA